MKLLIMICSGIVGFFIGIFFKHEAEFYFGFMILSGLIIILVDCKFNFKEFYKRFF